MKFRITYMQIFQYLIPFSLFAILNITIERQVYTDGGYEKLFGFPFSFISSNIGCSFCYQFYLLAFLIDFLTYFTLIFVMLELMLKAGFILKSNKISIFAVNILLFLYIGFIFSVCEYHLNLINTDIFSVSKILIHFGNYPL